MKILNKIIQELKWFWVCITKPKYHLSVYFGVPGSGKTTVAAWLAKKDMKKGKKVWSNVPIKGTYRLEPEVDIGVYNIQEGRVIIDEAGIEYNNRDFKTFTKKALKFYKLHRHDELHVDVFSQGFNDMDKKIRDLAYNLYLVKPSIIPFFIVVKQIIKYTGINEMTQDIQDCYKLGTIFTDKRFFAPPMWKMFDSYHREYKPEKQWDKW